MTDLPPGWEWTALGEVAETSLGKMLDKKQATGIHPTPYLRNINVRWGGFDLSDVASMDIRPDQLERVQAVSGDVIVCEGGEPGRAAVWRGPEPIALQKALHRIRPNPALHSGYLAHLLHHVALSRTLQRLFTGTTIKHLPQEKLRLVRIPLPPRAEQNRIVAALDEHLSRLDAARSTLEAAGRRSTVLRGRLLDSAFEVFADRRSVGELAEVRGGVQKQPKRRPSNNKAPFLRVANVLRGRLELDDVHEIELFDGERDRYRLEVGDLLVVEGNGSPDQIGRSAVWSGEVPDCVHQNHLIRVRPGEHIDAQFLGLYWNAPATARHLAAVASSTSGLYTLSTAKVKQVLVPAPPIPVQRQVVSEVQESLAALDRLEQDVQDARRGIAAMRRTILASAFSGQLVPQDPGDEPALVSLKRIQAAKSADRPPRKTRVPAL